jgi:hypothetical protein
VIDWLVGGLGQLFHFVGAASSAVAGWAWDKVTVGIYAWLANGLALLIQWVWGVLDSASTPRVTADWFRNGLADRLGIIALAITIAMMLASAMQASLSGRPEQILDALREGIRAVVASALTLTVLDVLIRLTDEASSMVWSGGRSDLKTMVERVVRVAAITGPLTHTFVGPLCLLLGFVGMLGLVVSLMMRSALIYVVAALAPLVWSTSVLPSMRGSARKLVHLAVSLVLSKLAIVVTLVVSVKLVANTGASSTSAADAAHNGASAVGMLLSGFVCFLVAAVTPFVLFRLMPTIEGAVVASGVAGGWGRSMTTAASTALMVKSFGVSKGASAATRAVAGQSGVAGSSSASPAPDEGSPATGAGGPSSRPSAPVSIPSMTTTPGAPTAGQASHVASPEGAGAGAGTGSMSPPSKRSVSGSQGTTGRKDR